MGTRSHPLALGGHSVDADAAQTEERVTAVQSAIIRAFAENGPMTDDGLFHAYEAIRRTVEDIPRASPQSVRSRRAELHHRGLVRATNIPGRSAYGRPATVWALSSSTKQELW